MNHEGDNGNCMDGDPETPFWVVIAVVLVTVIGLVLVATGIIKF